MRAFARVLMLALAVLGLVNAAWAINPPALGGLGVSGGLDLKGQLEKGLKCRRPSDFQYVAQIVQRVENGTLPRSLVDSTFAWARHKPSDRRVQYFQFGLRSRATKMGIQF